MYLLPRGSRCKNPKYLDKCENICFNTFNNVESDITLSYEDEYMEEKINKITGHIKRDENSFKSLSQATRALKRGTKMFIDEFLEALKGRVSDESLNKVKQGLKRPKALNANSLIEKK